MAKVIVAIIDIWTGLNKESYIGVVFSYLRGKCKRPVDELHSCEIHCLNSLEHAADLTPHKQLVALCPLIDSKHHDANSIKATLQYIMTQTYGINERRIHLLVGDNAAVNPATANLLDISFHGCMAHTINLSIKDILTGDSYGELEEIQIKVNSIIAFFNRSTTAKAQAEISRAIRGFCKTRFNSYFGSLNCIYKLKDKVTFFFERVFVARVSNYNRDDYDFETGAAIAPEKFDLEENDYRIIYIMLKFKDTFDKSIKMYSSAKSKIGDVLPIYHQLQEEVETICDTVRSNFDQLTEEGRLVGKARHNAHYLRVIQDSINSRYAAMSKSVLIVGAYLVAGSRTWEFNKIPTELSGVTSQFYSYVESIQVAGTGNDPEKTLYEEVLDHLVNMIKDLRHYNIGAILEPSDAQIRRDIKNWIEKPLSEYIISYSIVGTDGFIKQVDWKRVKQTNAVVSDLGKYY